MKSQIKFSRVMQNGNWFVFGIGWMICLSACTWNLDKISTAPDLCPNPNDCFVCGDSIWIDTRDGQEYRTIVIGNQCWFAENLNYGERINLGISQSNNEITEKYCDQNLDSRCKLFGGLYLLKEMQNYSTGTPQGICPSGWHVSLDEDWIMLEGILGLSENEVNMNHNWDRGKAQFVGNKLKMAGKCRGEIGQCGTSNFNAQLGGAVVDSNIVQFLGSLEFFWTSTKFPQDSSRYFGRALHEEIAGIYRSGYFEDWALSVRCVKDSFP